MKRLVVAVLMLGGVVALAVAGAVGVMRRLAHVMCWRCGTHRPADGAWDAGWRFVTCSDSEPRWECRECYLAEIRAEHIAARWS